VASKKSSKRTGSNKRRRTSKKPDDVNPHERKAAWYDAHGDARQAHCFVCRFNEVGWLNVGFHLAHVVPRAQGGNNSDTWNRVPTCNTCNKNVINGTNLFDLIAQHYPRRIVPVALYLWQRFVCAQRHIAQRYFEAFGLEAFVRTMYGTEGIEFPANGSALENDELTCCLRGALPDFGCAEQPGRIKNGALVYSTLRMYDDAVRERRVLERDTKRYEREVDALQTVAARLTQTRDASKQALKTARTLLRQLCDEHARDENTSGTG
jgi:hypothetical protein